MKYFALKETVFLSKMVSFFVILPKMVKPRQIETTTTHKKTQ